jgi:hypothetical protein
MTDTLTHGTAHFLSRAHAVRYYRLQGFHTRNEASKAVDRKLQDGSIFIGEPKCPEGSRIVLLDDGCRYGIEGPR